MSCTHESTCIPTPENQSVGTATVDGLTVSIAMEPDDFVGYAAIMPPNPLFTLGAPIRLSSPGDVLGGVTLFALLKVIL